MGRSAGARPRRWPAPRPQVDERTASATRGELRAGQGDGAPVQSAGVQTFSRNGLTFDVTDAGPADGPVVILLHGFPEDRRSWDGVVPALVAAGYRALVPDQRGYSPGACPKGRRPYKMEELEADVLALADAAGADRFDVAGHDWGAAVAPV